MRTIKNNSDARALVMLREEFKGNNIFACNRVAGGRKMYIVYSWGEHWPMFIYDDESGVWYGTSTRRSQSTGTHTRKCEPNVTIRWMRSENLQAIALRGIVGYVEHKIRAANSIGPGAAGIQV